MKKIIYYAADSSMGNTNEHDCSEYRSWATRQLVAEYPDYDIEVKDEESLVVAWTNDEENRGGIIEFCSRLWDSCPWDWVD